ncbi:hydrogenase expression protein HypE [Roseomonas sp. M0104]|uniref:Hydrogenase expression protein HypE n=1 Tax=Teichococcus coralli TaxID=2545983 RepID=A0A845BE65_9PROT|nr:nickel-dependent hydrogenase large subunit [Pseudoroseomonas coralli]MXP65411.1 hydrogenase expression protein HypE [Pseudoroseomonas coralli]
MSGPATRLILSGTARTPFRRELEPAAWAGLPGALRQQPDLELLALWAEIGAVHAAFRPSGGGSLLLASTAAEGNYPALSPARPAASWFERAIADLWGLRAEGGVDGRPWLDHGRWGFAAPLSARPLAQASEPPQPEFLPAEGEGVHQIPVGPIHAGIIEPGHFRLHVQGEAIVRLEARLGYAHKGTLGLMRGRSPRSAARLAARLSGDSTVAHAWAFAQAAEAALGVAVPPRAALLRGLMAELERIGNHLSDWGSLCNDAAFAWPHARCGALREGVLRASEAAFGHRLLMDRVVPGGVSIDIAPSGVAAIREALALVAAEMPALRRVTEDHASLQDRLAGTGVLRPDWAAAFAAGGFVGRASGRDFDARRDLPYAPYDALPFTVPVLQAGDVEARLSIRLEELAQSLALVAALLERLEPGDTLVSLPVRSGEGLGVVEGFRGEVLCWMALGEDGLIRSAFLRDPSWLQWPLLEVAVEGNIVADFPLCNKSFNCSYSGVDL